MAQIPDGPLLEGLKRMYGGNYDRYGVPGEALSCCVAFGAASRAL
jgi:hypothetical protein